MRHLNRLIAILLCAAMLFSLIGCGETAQPTTEPTVETTTEPPVTEPAPADQYSEAAAAVLAAEDLTVKLDTRKEITIGSETFTFTSTQDLTYSGYGTDGFRAAMTETQQLNDSDDKFDEYYADGTLFMTVYDEYCFKGSLTQEEYLARFAPAVLLDQTLYATVTKNGNTIDFSDPTDGESWVLPEGATLVSASGTAKLDADGNLTQTTYTISYTCGGIAITQEITADVTFGSGTITAPADESVYTELSYIDAPRAYDLAVSYLVASEYASSSIVETVVSQAAGYMHTEQYAIHYAGSDFKHASEVEYSINAYQGYESDSYTQTEHFQGGQYSITVDGGEAQTSNAVTTSAMLDYCMEYMLQNTTSLSYIADAEATFFGSILYLELSFNEEYGEFLNGYISTNLFNDENFLDDRATAYETTENTGYLAVDLTTGMPTALGYQYSGNHTIDGAVYAQSLQTDQSFDLASITAYNTITGKFRDDEEPENKATPLFYRVTGENGQEMWLLGTIHVGDERTAYLPQEIYDALEASDALALEFGGDAFEESLENDANLSAQVSAAYFYSDGSTTADHLDEELYESAVKLLKASGNYYMNAEYLKPSLWNQSIDNFFLRQGYQLQPEKGVDNRLEALAQEQGKEILDVESGLFQIQMITGYSDELQALMLEDSLEYTVADYTNSIAELYELWCAGDEAAMREELSSTVDTSELTEEELAEYEENKHLIDEYNQAMSYDRNDGMLEVAIGYLESGKTVFFAVGLAHLLDDVNGLVDTLAEAGYTVELVEYAG